jgi:dihydrofolate reductase/GAF domain-containing protein
MKWFTFAAAVVVPYFWLGEAVLGGERLAVLRQILTGLVVAGLPVAAGIAVLRYRLYDIDVVIRKTVVVGLMAAFISAVYVGLVVGVGTLVGSGGNALLSAAAAAIVALAFQPVRVRARRLADRLVYGQRATPYEVLSAFAERMGETYASAVLPRMARMLAEGMGASRAEVWLRSGSELRRASSFPEGSPSTTVQVRDGELPPFDGASVAVPVRHQGELLGAFVVTKAPSDPTTPAEESLVADVASQAGLVLRNAALIEDLRRSRQRIVAAQDEERRRLERNLHDGARWFHHRSNESVGTPLGGNDPGRFSAWQFDAKTDVDAGLVTELFDESTGAILMGRRMFDAGFEVWGDPPPYGRPVFVLTHETRDPLPMQGGTTHFFVTDVEAGLEQACAAAGEKDVSIWGGGTIIREHLRAGLVDEIGDPSGPGPAGAMAYACSRISNGRSNSDRPDVSRPQRRPTCASTL